MTTNRRIAIATLVVSLFVLIVGSNPSVAGLAVLTGDDADDGSNGSGHCNGTQCGSLFQNVFSLAISTSKSPGSGIVALGVNGSNAGNSLASWNALGNGGPGVAITILTTAAEIAAVDFFDYDMIYLPSVSAHTPGGMTSTQLAAINARGADIVNFVNAKDAGGNEIGGGLVALTQANVPGGWDWLPVGLVAVSGPQFTGVTVTSAMSTNPGISPNTTSGNLSHCCFHNTFSSASIAASNYKSLANASNASGSQNGEPTYVFAFPKIPTENCTNGIDDDGDGLIDQLDVEDCQPGHCGDGVLDLTTEECDDGNFVDGDGCDAFCHFENVQCTAQCKDVDTSTDSGVCNATVSIDDGSFDEDGDTIMLSQNPPGPYSLGSAMEVTLSCTDNRPEHPIADKCIGEVTVTDTEAPTALCNNAPGTITPPDAPIAFTGGAADNCGATVEISGYDCFMFTQKGKRIDKTESCVVSIAGDQITILDSGGVGDHITWTVVATDSSGNQSSVECEVTVENPGQGGMHRRF